MLRDEPDFLEILRILTKHEVKFIVVGGVSALARAPGADGPRPGDEVKVSLDPAYCVVFPT